MPPRLHLHAITCVSTLHVLLVLTATERPLYTLFLSVAWSMHMHRLPRLASPFSILHFSCNNLEPFLQAATNGRENVPIFRTSPHRRLQSSFGQALFLLFPSEARLPATRAAQLEAAIALEDNRHNKRVDALECLRDMRQICLHRRDHHHNHHTKTTRISTISMRT